MLTRSLVLPSEVEDLAVRVRNTNIFQTPETPRRTALQASRMHSPPPLRTSVSVGPDPFAGEC